MSGRRAKAKRRQLVDDLAAQVADWGPLWRRIVKAPAGTTFDIGGGWSLTTGPEPRLCGPWEDADDLGRIDPFESRAAAMVEALVHLERERAMRRVA